MAKRKISLIIVSIVYFFIAPLLLLTVYFSSLPLRMGETYHCLSGSTDQRILGQTVRPGEPNLKKNEGGVVKIEPVSTTVKNQTFPYDVYLWTDSAPKENPAFMQNMWQVSDTYTIWFRGFDSDANVLYPNSKFILSIKYDKSKLTTDQGVWLTESSLKMIYRQSATDQWHLVTESAVDLINHTVATITDRGGDYALVGGWWLTPTPSPIPLLTMYAKVRQLYPTKIPLPTKGEVIPTLTVESINPFMQIKIGGDNRALSAQSSITPTPVYKAQGVRCYSETPVSKKDLINIIIDDLSKALGINFFK